MTDEPGFDNLLNGKFLARWTIATIGLSAVYFVLVAMLTDWDLGGPTGSLVGWLLIDGGGWIALWYRRRTLRR